MPFYRFGSMFAHVKMASTKTRPAPLQCRAPHVWPSGKTAPCCAMSSALCDAPVDGKTCDMPICAEHVTEVGPDRHLCPRHAAEPELFAPC